MARKAKPAPIPNVWVSCQLQVIDEQTSRWKTVGSCPWTPNAIRAEVARLNAKGIRNIWVNGGGERKPTF